MFELALVYVGCLAWVVLEMYLDRRQAKREKQRRNPAMEKFIVVLVGCGVGVAGFAAGMVALAVLAWFWRRLLVALDWLERAVDFVLAVLLSALALPLVWCYDRLTDAGDFPY